MVISWRFLIAMAGGLQLCMLATCCHAQSVVVPASVRCGDVITVRTRDNSQTRYAYVPAPAGQQRPVVLLLLPGGPGYMDLDDSGCPRALKGNSLVRSIPIFNAAGFATALVDAPSEHHGEDGLGGFRTAAQHVHDLGKVIADLRARTQGAVWVVGTSRGSISAVNAASRLLGPEAPDGLVLTSALMAGQSFAKKEWVAQTVFDLPLETIRIPILVVGHAADKCARSPPDAMDKILARTKGARQQLVTVLGGPGHEGQVSINACEGRTPHGFVDQEAEVAAGIGRFVLGGNY
jgi:hypothetical protein